MAKLYLTLKQRNDLRGAYINGLFKNKKNAEDHLGFSEGKIMELDTDLVEEETPAALEPVRTEDRQAAQEIQTTV
jgi:hypothetical protein